MAYSKQIVVESHSDSNQRKKGKGVDFMENKTNQQLHTSAKSISGKSVGVFHAT